MVWNFKNLNKNIRQIMAPANINQQMYGITYDPDGRLDGKFQGLIYTWL